MVAAPLPRANSTPTPKDPSIQPRDAPPRRELESPHRELGTLRVMAWRDEIVDLVGVDPRSTYVERFWLPVLGPSATLLLRRTADGLEASPEGYELDLRETSRALGLGGSAGHRSALRRAIIRCARFDLVRPLGTGTLMARRRIAPLPHRHLSKLPGSLQNDHRSWELGRRARAVDAGARRARLLALELVGLGEDPGRVERHLVRWGVDAGEAAAANTWARDRHRAAARGSMGQSAP
jgi:hypothetical protein